MIAKFVLLAVLATVRANVPEFDYGGKSALAYGAYAPAAIKVAAPIQAAVKVAEPAYPPSPYEYGYSISDEHGHGSFGQQEVGDEHGNKKGSYTIKGNDGLYRTVEYVADEHGFRAHISTNEPGTAPISPANVQLNSQPVTVQAVAPVVKAVAAAPAVIKTPVYAAQSYAAPALLKAAAPVYASASYAAAPALLKAPVYGGVAQGYAGGAYAAAPTLLRAPTPVYASTSYAAAPALLKAPVYGGISQGYTGGAYAAAPSLLRAAPVYASTYSAAPALLKAPVYGGVAQGYAGGAYAAPALAKPAFAASAPTYVNAGPLSALGKAPVLQGHY